MGTIFRRAGGCFALVLVFAGGASAQDILGMIVEGVKHVGNEVGKVVNNTTPVQVDLRQGGRVIFNGPVDSVSFDPATGRAIRNPSPALQFVQAAPGLPMCHGVRTAKAALRTHYQLPADVARDLVALGVAPHIVQKTTWSPDWSATNYMPGTGNQGAVVVEDVVIISDNRLVHDRAFMAHELKHVQQYERLGTDNFCSQYTTNSWIFENEAKDEEARVERAIEAGKGVAAQSGDPNGPPNPPTGLRAPVYYSSCATPAGTGPTIQGGLPHGAACWIQTAWGPVWGTVVGFYR